MAYSDEQRQLAEELSNLAKRAGAKNAFVFDAWGLIWCSGSLTFGENQARLYAQVGAILEGLDPPLARGAKVDRIFTHELSMYCVSFAATYVLGVWLAEETNEFTLRRTVKAALPRIESMTLALPPPDGTDTTSGAGSNRA
jgi:hypothetical protein